MTIGSISTSTTTASREDSGKLLENFLLKLRSHKTLSHQSMHAKAYYSSACFFCFSSFLPHHHHHTFFIFHFSVLFYMLILTSQQVVECILGSFPGKVQHGRVGGRADLYPGTCPRSDIDIVFFTMLNRNESISCCKTRQGKAGLANHRYHYLSSNLAFQLLHSSSSSPRPSRWWVRWASKGNRSNLLGG